MTGGLDHAVWTGADQIAEGGEKLQENRGRIGFRVRCDGADNRSGETVERLRGKPRRPGTHGRPGQAHGRPGQVGQPVSKPVFRPVFWGGGGVGGVGRACSSGWW